MNRSVPSTLFFLASTAVAMAVNYPHLQDPGSSAENALLPAVIGVAGMTYLGFRGRRRNGQRIPRG